MKKSLAVVLGLVSATTLADETKNLPALQPLAQNAPVLVVGVYDVSNKVVRAVPERKLSLSNKNHQLCWTALNVPSELTNKVTEIFVAPEKANFVDSSSSIAVSKDGKKHTITVNIPRQSKDFLERCWRFNKNDPLGKYILEVQINDIKFPAQSFELVK